MKKSNRKRVREFNLIRFCVSISIIAMLLVGTGIIAFAVLSDNELENNDVAMENMYTKYCVHSGDTIWSIAKLVNKEVYNEKKDVRYIIHEIKKINNLNSADIYTGNIIYLPKF